MQQETTSSTAVIVVDVQADFTEWKNGSLVVPGTDEVYVKQVEEATRLLKNSGFPILATMDWHPKDHISFFTTHPGKKAFEIVQLHGHDQTLWPPHCVQGTENARILVDNSLFDAIVQTGADKRFESYSGFKDDAGQKTELEAILQQIGVTNVVMYGIATDYCVRATALDAVDRGYQVILIKELCRGVAPETSQQALEEMKQAGIVILDELDIHKVGAV